MKTSSKREELHYWFYQLIFPQGWSSFLFFFFSPLQLALLLSVKGRSPRPQSSVRRWFTLQLCMRKSVPSHQGLQRLSSPCFAVGRQTSALSHSVLGQGGISSRASSCFHIVSGSEVSGAESVPEPVGVTTGDWDYNVEVAKAHTCSAIFIPYEKGSRSNKERCVGGTEQQEGNDISKEGKMQMGI